MREHSAKPEFTRKKVNIAKQARTRGHVQAKRSSKDDESRVRFLAELQARREARTE